MPSRSFVRSTESVAEARQFVAQALNQISKDLRNVVTLLVSELATNALLYGPNGFQVSVEYRPNSHLVRVGVSDPGDGTPTVEHPDVTAEHGRGLQLVGALSDRWGVESIPGTPGKTVWFELTETAIAVATNDEAASSSQESPRRDGQRLSAVEETAPPRDHVQDSPSRSCGSRITQSRLASASARPNRRARAALTPCWREPGTRWRSRVA
jgi:anti-sigma regulatory factor (Ser/Thr protein kinase)